MADVSDLSRHALVSFLRLDGDGGQRSELVTWLFGPYLDALTVGRESLLETEPSLVIDDAPAQEAAAAAIASATRAIEGVLVAFHQDPDLSIATRVVEQRIVEPIIDERGASGYAPLGGRGMPLTVRVLALLTAELLARPERLFADLVVDATAIEIASRGVASGVAMRSRQTLPWRPSLDERNRDAGWPARPPTLAELVAAQDGADGADGAKGQS